MTMEQVGQVESKSLQWSIELKSIAAPTKHQVVYFGMKTCFHKVCECG